MNQHNPQKVQTLFIIWGALTFSTLLYVFVAYTINQQRAGSSATTLRDNLTGALQYLPYLLPILLGGLGIIVFHKFLASARRGPCLSQIQTAAILMLAVFEVNVIIGLVFFFMGAPFPKFVPFAVGTVALNLVGLQRIIAALSR